MPKKFNSYKYKYTYEIILPFFILLIPLFLKTSLGPDEQNYIHYGKQLLETGSYSFIKGHPFTGFISASFDTIFDDPLKSYLFIYYIFSIINYLGVLALVKEFDNNIDVNLFTRLFICLCPGTYLLSLYAITHIIYSGFLTYFLLFLVRAINSNNTRQIYYFTSASIIVALMYYTRLDGLITFILSVIVIIFISLNKMSEIKLISILFYIITFIILVLPWHITLYINDHFLSPIIYGGWESNIWEDGPAKYFLGHKTRIPFDSISITQHFFMPLAKNVVRMSESLGSIMLFPIFLWPFLILGFSNFKKNPQYFILISMPLITSLSYLFFYVEIRFLIPSVLPLTIIFILSTLKINKEIKPLPTIIITLLCFVNIGFSVGWIN